MSSEQHEEVAVREEAAANAHLAKYDPAATERTQHCASGGGAGGGLDSAFVGGCWIAVTNPTAAHLEAAKRYEKAAADHRAASKSLDQAEHKACVGLSAYDRDVSPFEHREEVVSVQALETTRGGGKSRVTEAQGAVVTFRAVGGMTEKWLQRAVDCQLARNASVGFNVPEMPTCPLVLKGVTAKVASTDAGLAVTVRSDDPETAAEVVRRAKSLVAN